MHLVYYIVNDNNIVEHVGSTNNPKYRFDQHTKFRYYGSSTQGKFYKREDVRMEEVQWFDTEKEAFAFEKAERKRLGLVEPRRPRTTPEEAAVIRRAYDVDGIRIKDLATDFGKCQQVIIAILDNTTCYNPEYTPTYQPKKYGK